MTFEKEKHIAELVVRYVTGTITAQESEELEAWRSSRPANGEIFDRMLSRTEFDKNVERYTKSGRDAVREWRRIENRGPGKKKHRRLTVARYAAAIAVVAVSVLGYYTLSEQAQKTAVVAGACGRKSEQIRVSGHRLEYRAQCDSRRQYRFTQRRTLFTRYSKYVARL